MKAIVIDRFGSLDQIHLAEVPKPAPKSSEVLVQIAYASVNPIDWKIAEGHLKEVMGHRFPVTLGWDAAGTIVEVGMEAARTFSVGEKVYAYCRKQEIHDGTYAEFIALEASMVAPIPKGLGLREASAIPLVALTAWQCLFDKAKLKAGQVSLIHGGAGGVGGIAIQLAKQAGAQVITTASGKNHPYVSELGADTIIDYTEQNFATAVRDLYPHGVDVVFDTVGGGTLKDSYSLLKKGGHLVSIVEPPDELRARTLGFGASHHFVVPSGAELREIAQLIESKKVIPLDIEEMPLEKAAEALKKSQSRHQRGKLVLKI
jgi:NADPH:quinone reductase-like Zn-dependent oxidoreductase